MFNLKKYREQKKITQNKLAEMFNVTQKTVSAWESGRNEPNFETLLKLANLFDCSIDELLDREEIEQEKKQPEQVELEIIPNEDFAKLKNFSKLKQNCFNMLAEMSEAEADRVRIFMLGVTGKEFEYFTKD